MAGAAGLVVSLEPGLLRRVLASGATPVRRWSDPATWGGRVPGRYDVAVVTGTVLLDVSARVAGVVIEPGALLTFRRRKSVTLRSSGNVVVLGKLRMRPRFRRISHRLVFVGVDEKRF